MSNPKDDEPRLVKEYLTRSIYQGDEEFAEIVKEEIINSIKKLRGYD